MKFSFIAFQEISECLISRIKSKNGAPITPRSIDTVAEGKGIYLTKTPIVPYINIDKITFILAESVLFIPLCVSLKRPTSSKAW